MSTTAQLAVDERVLPSHLVWAKNYLTAIYSSEPERSAQLFDAFLSPKVVIVANGTEALRADYIDFMRKNTFIHEGARVTFPASIDATYQPKDPKPGDWSKSLGLFFTVDYPQDGATAQGASQSPKLSVCMNLVVEVDPDIPRPTGHFHYFDGRRVMALNQVFAVVHT